MEVTKTNFKDVLSQVTQAVKEASFLAIDAEFTGLESGTPIHAFDTPEERYMKLIKAAKEYIIVQFGLSVFHYNQQSDKYQVRSFNFYLCPRQFGKAGPDKRFKCQSSSIDFLACHGLDFGKVFRDGISYLLPSDAQKLTESLQQKHSQQSMRLLPSTPTGTVQTPPTDAIPIPEQHQTFINNILEQVAQFVDKPSSNSLDLEPCNSYLRRLIYQSVKHRFGTKLHLESVTNERQECHIRVTMGRSNEEQKQMEKERQAADFQELDDAIGFTKVITLISQSGKLIVGHNMILDLLHVVEQFVTPLPETYEEFKQLVPCVFPRILDTKHMASSDPFKDHISSTVLTDVFRDLEKSPFGRPQVDLLAECARYDTGDHLHEAGYDSYITGLCFIAMLKYLANSTKPPVKHISAESTAIHQYVNKLHLMRMTDVPFINLSGPDAKLSRDHVFHLTFPSEWKTDNIARLFSPFGSVQIVWIDDTSAFVGLYNRDQTHAAFSSLMASSDHTYRLLTYKQYSVFKSTPHTNVPTNKSNASVHSVTPPPSRGVKRELTCPDGDLTLKKPRRSSHGSVPSVPTIPEEDAEVVEEVFTPTGVSGREIDGEAPTLIINTEGKGIKLFDEPTDW